jgi:hypothetical protein
MAHQAIMNANGKDTLLQTRKAFSGKIVSCPLESRKSIIALKNTYAL